METICHIVWMFKPALVNMYIILSLNSTFNLTFLTANLSLANFILMTLIWRQHFLLIITISILLFT